MPSNSLVLGFISFGHFMMTGSGHLFKFIGHFTHEDKQLFLQTSPLGVKFRNGHECVETKGRRHRNYSVLDESLLNVYLNTLLTNEWLLVHHYE